MNATQKIIDAALELRGETFVEDKTIFAADYGYVSDHAIARVDGRTRLPVEFKHTHIRFPQTIPAGTFLDRIGAVSKHGICAKNTLKGIVVHDSPLVDVFGCYGEGISVATLRFKGEQGLTVQLLPDGTLECL